MVNARFCLIEYLLGENRGGSTGAPPDDAMRGAYHFLAEGLRLSCLFSEQEVEPAGQGTHAPIDSSGWAATRSARILRVW